MASSHRVILSQNMEIEDEDYTDHFHMEIILFEGKTCQEMKLKLNHSGNLFIQWKSNLEQIDCLCNQIDVFKKRTIFGSQKKSKKLFVFEAVIGGFYHIDEYESQSQYQPCFFKTKGYKNDYIIKVIFNVPDIAVNYKILIDKYSNYFRKAIQRHRLVSLCNDKDSIGIADIQKLMKIYPDFIEKLFPPRIIFSYSR